MLKEFVEKILSLGATEKFIFGDREYTSKTIVPVKPPLSDALEVHTLTGIKDYLVGNPDALDTDSIIVQVTNHLSVEVFSSLGVPWMDRHDHITAKINPKVFPFGNFLSTEEMIIALQTYFVQTETAAKLMKVVGNIADDTSVRTLDDGISQEVTAKAGIARLADVHLPNPIVLQPYRTFLEVEQPESKFIFRMRKKEGSLPVCALFEADGGNWQLEAIKRVRDWLRVNLPEGVSANIIA